MVGTTEFDASSIKNANLAADESNDWLKMINFKSQRVTGF
jgi:hypothetical protein